MDTKLENCSPAELYDLLASTTIKLLGAITRKADGATLKNFRKEVEAIQKVIREREKELKR